MMLKEIKEVWDEIERGEFVETSKEDFLDELKKW